jgi:flagella basal body P-ring formation protein FlgA
MPSNIPQHWSSGFTYASDRPWFAKNALSHCLLYLFLPAIAHGSADWETTASLSQAVESYARSQTADLPGRVLINIGAIDPRLRLPRCKQTAPFVPPGSKLWGNSTVGLRCNEPSPWTIYVPVTVNVIIGVVTTSRHLPRDHLLTASDLVTRDGDLTQLPAGTLTDTAPALGKLLAVGVPSGTALRVDMLRAPLAVVQGQKVKLLVQGHGFKVNGEGTALTSAPVGQPASVRTASGRVVSGIARGQGLVEITP